MTNQPGSILSRLDPQIAREIETWVVNSVKVKMINKLDKLCETEGKINARKLFLVPIFNISDMAKRVEKQAPELKTLFYRELAITLQEVGSRFV